MQPNIHFPRASLLGYLSCLLLVVVAGSLLSSEGVRAQREENRALPMLQDHLTRLIDEEASLRREVREGVQLATRPYASYLLHQKSLQLVENTHRLHQLKKEKIEIIQRLARMEDRFDPGVGPFILDEESRQIALASTYSGAPSLSFNHAIRIDSEDPPHLSPPWVGFFRFVFLGYVMLIFTLPLIAIQKRRASSSRERGKAYVRVFPILTIQRRDGGCELLCLPGKAGSY